MELYAYRSLTKRVSMIHVLTLSALFLFTGCSGYKYQPDNVVEESVEFLVDQKLGVDLDLTPDNPEKGFSPKSLKPLVKE